MRLKYEPSGRPQYQSVREVSTAGWHRDPAPALPAGPRAVANLQMDAVVAKMTEKIYPARVAKGVNVMNTGCVKQTGINPSHYSQQGGGSTGGMSEAPKGGRAASPPPPQVTEYGCEKVSPPGSSFSRSPTATKEVLTVPCLGGASSSGPLSVHGV